MTDKNIIDAAMRRWKNGELCIAIANDIGVSRRTINHWASARGLTRPRPARPHPAHALRAAILRDYRDGRTVGWLAEVYGIARQTITTWAKQAGIYANRRRLNRDAVIATYFRTMSYRKTASELGCSITGVASIVNGKTRLLG